MIDQLITENNITSLVQCGPPAVISWFITPMSTTIISNINQSYWSYSVIGTNLAIRNQLHPPGKTHMLFGLNHHFPRVFLGFSYGFPMVFLWFSYGFPWFSHGFPMVFPWFSQGPGPGTAAADRWTTCEDGCAGLVAEQQKHQGLGMYCACLLPYYVFTYIHTFSMYIKDTICICCLWI